MEDVIIIGAGPCGLAAATSLESIGISPLLIEKGPVVNTIYRFPVQMQFFSTSELMEIGEIPFLSTLEKPSRAEALQYYRTVADRRNLRVRTYEEVLTLDKKDGHFVLTSKDRLGQTFSYQAKHVIVAIGYYDTPNLLNVPGEDLPKVTHYYQESHPYHGAKVAVIGGKNSAVEAAMELHRVGADVTVIYRGNEISDSVKAWVRPVFESSLEKGWIKMMWNSQVTEITETEIVVNENSRSVSLENDFVLALTGYAPDHSLLKSVGVIIDEESGRPELNLETMETNVEGLFVAGVIAAGYNANEIFIENGRLHGPLIASKIGKTIK